MNSIAELTKEIERLMQALADKDLALMEAQELAQAANRQAEAACRDKENAAQQAQQWAGEARMHRGTVLDILRHFGCAEEDWHALELIKAALAAPQQHAQAPLSDEQLDEHINAILRPSGTRISNYTMQKSRDDMRAAMRAILSTSQPAAAQADERCPIVHGGSVEVAHLIAIAKATGLFGAASVTNIKNYSIALLNEFAVKPAIAPVAIDVAQGVAGIRPWQERTKDKGVFGPADAMVLEIYELRAAIALRAASQPTEQQLNRLQQSVFDAGKAYGALSERDSERDAALPSLIVSRAGYDVWAERERQMAVEGWTPEGDDDYTERQLSRAAACYALHTEPVGNVGDYLRFWPWANAWWKPTDQRRNLVKAGALILAEIERIDRAAMAVQQGVKGEKL